jgi:hypothetical protein
MLLESMVQKVTGIDMRALRERPLSEFSIEERKSWAEHRSTKRQEDEIFSLLGISDVTMLGIDIWRWKRQGV